MLIYLISEYNYGFSGTCDIIFPSEFSVFQGGSAWET